MSVAFWLGVGMGGVLYVAIWYFAIHPSFRRLHFWRARALAQPPQPAPRHPSRDGDPTVTPLSADDLARLRNLGQYDRTAPLLAETAQRLVGTVEELRGLLRDVVGCWAIALAVLEENCDPLLPSTERGYMVGDLIRVERQRREQLEARIDAALSAEPASTD